MSCEGGDADDIPGEACSLLHKIASQWNGIVNVQELALKILQGSMTNRVYECHWSWEDGHCPKKVLVRIYRNSANLLFERENEIITFERMSQLGHGPRLLGRFPNGRLEEFLDARAPQGNEDHKASCWARAQEQIGRRPTIARSDTMLNITMVKTRV